MPGDLRTTVAALSESKRKRGPVEFDDRFTIFPDLSVTQLHCSACETRWTVGYHPSLDSLAEQARAHNRERHGGPAVR
jgi:hypothetical protein